LKSSIENALRQIQHLRSSLSERHHRVPIDPTIESLKDTTAQRSVSTIDMANSAPTVRQFLGEISRIIQDRNGAQLKDYLVIEPPYSEIYNTMIHELRHTYPKDREDALEDVCSSALPLAREGWEGATWTHLIRFMVRYFGFIRDVDISNLLFTYQLLSDLLKYV